jgi:hypothetical protein
LVFRVLWPVLLLGCSEHAHLRLLEPGGGSPGGPNADIDASDPRSSLVLRYDFSGSGTVVRDRVGTSDGQILGGAVLDGSGGLTLDGGDDYVDMPNGIVSRLGSASFVIWLQWRGGVCWQRVFDFGSNDRGEDRVGYALSSLFMTPATCGTGTFTVSGEFASGVQSRVGDDEPLPADTDLQVALVLDAEAATLTLYRDGAAVAEGPAEFELAEIDDVNNWLGRSQWVQDYFLAGRYDELRIYDRALSAREVAAQRERGPDDP